MTQLTRLLLRTQLTVLLLLLTLYYTNQVLLVLDIKPVELTSEVENANDDANVTYAGIFAEVTGTATWERTNASKFFTVQSGTLSEAARITEAGHYKLQQDKGIDFSNQTSLPG